MAQSWRDKRSGGKEKPARPIDAAGLKRLALRYVERYATTRAKLGDYLARKLRERGWAGEGGPDVGSLVERFAELGYVDDAAFAAQRAAGLSRRGYGPRRIDVALKVAGVDEADGAEAREIAVDSAWAAALAFAKKRRIGPFAAAVPERPQRDKNFAAMLRAGHSSDHARRILAANPGDVPDEDGW